MRMRVLLTICSTTVVIILFILSMQLPQLPQQSTQSSEQQQQPQQKLPQRVQQVQQQTRPAHQESSTQLPTPALQPPKATETVESRRAYLTRCLVQGNWSKDLTKDFDAAVERYQGVTANQNNSE